MSDDNYIGIVKSVFANLDIPKNNKEIIYEDCPEMENGIMLGRSKKQYHMIFSNISDIRSNHLKVQNRLSRYSDYEISKGGKNSKTDFVSLGVRTDEPYLDFLSTVVGKLHEIKFVRGSKLSPQDAMDKIENHILLLLNNLATNESMLGLLGELFVIREIKQAGFGIDSVINWWTGYQNASRDFCIQNGDKKVYIEVKSTTKNNFPRTHHISSFAQVVPDDEGPLYLASIGCEPSNKDDATSVSIESLANEIAKELSGEDLINFKSGLLNYGNLDSEDRESYICFDIDWPKKPNWSQQYWKLGAHILDLNENSGFRVPALSIFYGTHVIPKTVKFSIQFESPIDRLNPENPHLMTSDYLSKIINRD
jgi:hypothetical protein